MRYGILLYIAQAQHISFSRSPWVVSSILSVDTGPVCVLQSSRTIENVRWWSICHHLVFCRLWPEQQRCSWYQTNSTVRGEVWCLAEQASAHWGL